MPGTRDLADGRCKTVVEKYRDDFDEKDATYPEGKHIEIVKKFMYNLRCDSIPEFPMNGRAEGREERFISRN